MGFYTATEFVPEASIGYLARRVHQLAQVGLEPVFAAEGLNYIQWHALVSIFFGRGQTCAALARDLAYDKGATTRLLDALVAKGWVRRERGEDDRRLVTLALTPGGETKAQEVRAKVVDAWNGWIEDWSSDDLAQALAALQRLRLTLEEKVL